MYTLYKTSFHTSCVYVADSDELLGCFVCYVSDSRSFLPTRLGCREKERTSERTVVVRILLAKSYDYVAVIKMICTLWNERRDALLALCYTSLFSILSLCEIYVEYFTRYFFRTVISHSVAVRYNKARFRLEIYFL